MLHKVQVPTEGSWPEDVITLMSHFREAVVKGAIQSVDNGIMSVDLFTIDTGDWVNQMVNLALEKAGKSAGKGTAGGKIAAGHSPKSVSPGTVQQKSPSPKAVTQTQQSLTSSVQKTGSKSPAISEMSLPVDGTRVGVIVSQVS